MEYGNVTSDRAYENLQSAFSNTVRRRIRELGKTAAEVGRATHREMGVSEGTAKAKVGTAIGGHPYDLKKILPFGRYSEHGRSAERVLLSSPSVRHSAVLLDYLGIPEDDPLIQEIRHWYPSFTYPPVRTISKGVSNMPLQSRIANYREILRDESDVQDPLVLMRSFFENYAELETERNRINKMPVTYLDSEVITEGFSQSQINYLISDNQNWSRSLRLGLAAVGDRKGKGSIVDNLYFEDPQHALDVVPSLESVVVEGANLFVFDAFLENHEPDGMEVMRIGRIRGGKIKAYKANGGWRRSSIQDNFEGVRNPTPRHYVDWLIQTFFSGNYDQENPVIVPAEPKPKRIRVGEAKRNGQRKLEELPGGDPLRFTQEMTLKFGTGLLQYKEQRNSIIGTKDDPMIDEILWRAHDIGGYEGGKNVHVNFGLWSYNRDDPCPAQPTKISEDFYDYLKDRVKVNGKRFSDFDLATDSLDDLGDFRENFTFECFVQHSTRRPRANRWTEPVVFIKLTPTSKGYDLDVDFTTEDGKTLRSDYKDIKSSVSRDARPWIHRSLELLHGVPEKDWHDPRIYDGSTRIDNVVDSTIDVLFAGDEKERLAKQVAQARLKMRGNWQSVPRLNLGAIQLPKPGMKDVEQDDFVVQATPYMVEYLSHLGVMNREEAEQVAAQRLTNYFVNQAGFQLSRDRAVEIVDSLREREVPYVEEVA